MIENISDKLDMFMKDINKLEEKYKLTNEEILKVETIRLKNVLGDELADELADVNVDFKNIDKCLRCGKEEASYCESCFQELISENARLQKELHDLKGRKEKENIVENQMK